MHCTLGVLVFAEHFSTARGADESVFARSRSHPRPTRHREPTLHRAKLSAPHPRTAVRRELAIPSRLATCFFLLSCEGGKLTFVQKVRSAAQCFRTSPPRPQPVTDVAAHHHDGGDVFREGASVSAPFAAAASDADVPSYAPPVSASPTVLLRPLPPQPPKAKKGKSQCHHLLTLAPAR